VGLSITPNQFIVAWWPGTAAYGIGLRPSSAARFQPLYGSHNRPR
jgi:hypothetical protein